MTEIFNEKNYLLNEMYLSYMTDWRRGAIESVQGHLDDLREIGCVDEADRLEASIGESSGDFDRTEFSDAVDEVTDCVVDEAHETLDLAVDVDALKDQTNELQGREPTGYSTPDAGVKHDAYYGMRAQRRSWARRLSWPLRLDEWDHREATVNRPDRPGGQPSTEKIEIEGTDVWEDQIGGVPIWIVTDETQKDPPI